MNIRDIDMDKFSNPEKYPDYQTPEICKVACYRHPDLIKFVVDQSPSLCWSCLVIDKTCIEHIREPTDDMWDTVLHANAKLISLHKNPSLELCKMVLKMYSTNHRYIRNQPEGLCDLLVDTYLSTDKTSNLGSIRRWNKSAWTKVLNESTRNIRYIRHQTNDMCVYALDLAIASNDINLINFVVDSIKIEPSDEIQKRFNKIKLLYG